MDDDENVISRLVGRVQFQKALLVRLLNLARTEWTQPSGLFELIGDSWNRRVLLAKCRSKFRLFVFLEHYLTVGPHD